MLFEFAKKHGRECTDEEYEIYANDFVHEMYYMHQYYFYMMHGQGTIVRFCKERNEKTRIKDEIKFNSEYTKHFEIQEDRNKESFADGI